MHSLMTATAEDTYATGECDLETLIADVRGALWPIIKHKGVYVIFLRTAQCSRGAPQSWAAVAAMIVGIVQYLYMSNSRIQDCKCMLTIGFQRSAELSGRDAVWR